MAPTSAQEEPTLLTMTPGSYNEAEKRKQLVALLTQHQRRIFSYIYTLVPDRTDAEDLLQEASLIICEKFDDFEVGTDFVAWAPDRPAVRDGPARSTACSLGGGGEMRPHGASLVPLDWNFVLPFPCSGCGAAPAHHRGLSHRSVRA